MFLLPLVDTQPFRFVPYLIVPVLAIAIIALGVFLLRRSSKKRS